jgi:hypothetical protein
VKERKCTKCHDPHQSPNQFMLLNEGSWIIPKVLRCTVDIFSQILYDRTVDVGKTSKTQRSGFGVKK